MQTHTRAPSRRLALVALALSLAVLPGAAMSATAPPADAPAAPSDVVATAALTRATDSVAVRVRWEAATDALGEATMYTVTVRDSANGAALAVGSTTNASATPRELTFRLAAPAVATSQVLRIEVVARRRALSSAPGVAHFRLSTADTPPPTPGGVIVDTLPFAPPAAILVGAGPGDECRPLVASLAGDVRGDTATFVRALDGMTPADVHLYCVGVDLVVLLDGWTGDTELAPSIYGPGEALPLSRPALDVGSARYLGA